MQGVMLCNRLGTQARIGIVILGKGLGLGDDWWSQSTITSLIAIGWRTSLDYHDYGILHNRLRLDKVDFTPLTFSIF